MCGNFNNDLTDDTLIPSGVNIKDTTQFALEWKTNADCVSQATERYMGKCALSEGYREYSKSLCKTLRYGEYTINPPIRPGIR